jgi:hypothetical protein
MKLGRNELCHCRSGKKYKRCCLDRDRERERIKRGHDDAFGRQHLDAHSRAVPRQQG